jgi:hypothetical protein
MFSFSDPPGWVTVSDLRISTNFKLDDDQHSKNTKDAALRSVVFLNIPLLDKLI